MFHGLEFALRAFLYKYQSPEAQRFPWGQDFYAHPIGTSVPLNPITDFSSLGALIKRYNQFVEAANEHRFRIDSDVVAVRDALAHGRVSAPGDSETLELVKYDRPNKQDPNHVRVSYRVSVTPEWLKSQATQVEAQTMLVVTAYETMSEPEGRK